MKNEAFRHNSAQRRILQQIEEAQKSGRPLRFIIPKGRGYRPEWKRGVLEKY